MLLPLPFGPTIPKNSPRSIAEGHVVERALRLVRHALERVQEVLLERRALLVREPERLRDADDLDGGPCHTRSANHGSCFLNIQRPSPKIANVIPIGISRPADESNASVAVIRFGATSW